MPNCIFEKLININDEGTLNIKILKGKKHNIKEPIQINMNNNQTKMYKYVKISKHDYLCFEYTFNSKNIYETISSDNLENNKLNKESNNNKMDNSDNRESNNSETDSETDSKNNNSETDDSENNNSETDDSENNNSETDNETDSETDDSEKNNSETYSETNDKSTCSNIDSVKDTKNNWDEEYFINLIKNIPNSIKEFKKYRQKMIKDNSYKKWSHEKIVKKLNKDYHNIIELLAAEEDYDNKYRFIHKYNNNNDYYFGDWVNEIQDFIKSNYKIMFYQKHKDYVQMSDCYKKFKEHLQKNNIWIDEIPLSKFNKYMTYLCYHKKKINKGNIYLGLVSK